MSPGRGRRAPPQTGPRPHAAGREANLSAARPPPSAIRRWRSTWSLNADSSSSSFSSGCPPIIRPVPDSRRDQLERHVIRAEGGGAQRAPAVPFAGPHAVIRFIVGKLGGSQIRSYTVAYRKSTDLLGAGPPGRTGQVSGFLDSFDGLRLRQPDRRPVGDCGGAGVRTIKGGHGDGGDAGVGEGRACGQVWGRLKGRGGRWRARSCAQGRNQDRVDDAGHIVFGDGSALSGKLLISHGREDASESVEI